MRDTYDYFSSNISFRRLVHLSIAFYVLNTFLATSSFSANTDSMTLSITIGFEDQDDDGMPDDYENVNGFNLNSSSDATLDADEDGQSNIEEFLSGTDPNNSTSLLQVVSFDLMTSNRVMVTWDSSSSTVPVDREYALVAISKLADFTTNTEVVATGILSQGNQTAIIIDTNTTASKRFYSIKLIKPFLE